MKTVLSLAAAFAVGLFLFTASGCREDSHTGPGEPIYTIVTGSVVAIEDLVPVDGGVTIDLECSNGRSERLLFPSLFTNPPPTEDVQELYQLILRVEIGDLVQAKGTRVDGGIKLEDLKILRK